MVRRKAMREIVKMLVVLTAISVVSGGTLAYIEKATREPIEYQKLRFVKGPAVLAVLSGYDNDPIKDYQKDVLLGKKENLNVRKSLFPAKKNGKCFAVAFEVPGEGYGGSMGIMIGIELKTGHLTGMRVMTHSETPGLGARSVEPAFYKQFSGLSPQTVALSDKGGKINAISGATVTSQGVVAAVKKGLDLFQMSKEEILTALKTQ
jgi:electron transport complex protein RnfG